MEDKFENVSNRYSRYPSQSMDRGEAINVKHLKRNLYQVLYRGIFGIKDEMFYITNLHSGEDVSPLTLHVYLKTEVLLDKEIQHIKSSVCKPYYFLEALL